VRELTRPRRLLAAARTVFRGNLVSGRQIDDLLISGFEDGGDRGGNRFPAVSASGIEYRSLSKCCRTSPLSVSAGPEHRLIYRSPLRHNRDENV
jgi:hypothetical protein